MGQNNFAITNERGEIHMLNKSHKFNKKKDRTMAKNKRQIFKQKLHNTT